MSLCGRLKNLFHNGILKHICEYSNVKETMGVGKYYYCYNNEMWGIRLSAYCFTYSLTCTLCNFMKFSVSYTVFIRYCCISKRSNRVLAVYTFSAGNLICRWRKSLQFVWFTISLCNLTNSIWLRSSAGVELKMGKWKRELPKWLWKCMRCAFNTFNRICATTRVEVELFATGRGKVSSMKSLAVIKSTLPAKTVWSVVKLRSRP